MSSLEMEENPYKAAQTTTERRANRGQLRLQAREYFGLVVRTIALLTIGMSIWQNVGGLIAPAPGFTWMDYIPAMLPGIVIGLIVLVLADSLAAWSYRREPLDLDDSSTD